MNLQEAAVTQTPKHLSYAEEQTLKQKIQQLEDARDGVEVKGAQGVVNQAKDKKIVSANLDRLKKIQEAQAVQRADGVERAELEKEEKILRDRLDPGMTWDQYSTTQRKHGMRYQKLVGQIQKWNSDQKYQADVARWKYIRRRLDPDDPNISNTMHLFHD
jgi:hypothetical protein